MEQRTAAHVVPDPGHRFDDRYLGLDPTDSQPGGNDLAEGAYLDNAVAVRNGVQRWRWGLIKEDLRVGHVLHDEDVVLGTDLDEGFTGGQGHGSARGVVEVRDGVEQLDPLAGCLDLVGSSIHTSGKVAVVSQLRFNDLAEMPADGPKGASEVRLLCDHDIARVQEGIADGIYASGAAVGQQEVIHFKRNALNAPLAACQNLAEIIKAKDSTVAERLSRVCC